jgi:hypothetical protein
MTPMEQQIENPRCSACGDEMELTVLIPPFGGFAQDFYLPEVWTLGRLSRYIALAGRLRRFVAPKGGRSVPVFTE